MIVGHDHEKETGTPTSLGLERPAAFDPLFLQTVTHILKRLSKESLVINVSVTLTAGNRLRGQGQGAGPDLWTRSKP